MASILQVIDRYYPTPGVPSAFLMTSWEASGEKYGLPRVQPFIAWTPELLDRLVTDAAGRLVVLDVEGDWCRWGYSAGGDRVRQSVREVAEFYSRLAEFVTALRETSGERLRIGCHEFPFPVDRVLANRFGGNPAGIGPTNDHLRRLLDSGPAAPLLQSVDYACFTSYASADWPYENGWKWRLTHGIDRERRNGKQAAVMLNHRATWGGARLSLSAWKDQLKTAHREADLIILIDSPAPDNRLDGDWLKAVVEPN